MSIEKSQSEISIDDQNYNFPYKFGISKELENVNSNNYFNASIHCLVNIKSLSIQLIKSPNLNNDKYIKFISNLTEIEGNEEKKNNYIKESIKELKKYIINEKKYPYEINNDPRKLIDFLLKDLLKKNELPKEMLTIINKECSSCGKITESNDDALNIVKFNIPEIIKSKNINKNNNTIQNNKITIYDCFDYYLKSLNNKQSFYCHKCQSQKFVISKIELPSILIIFIDYGTNKNCCYENSYEFDEEINFKKIGLENNNKEYFLSSIIACKNIGTYFELFYTFAREDESSKYILYNGMEVRNNIGVKNKLIKNKINLKDKKQSWPFVLIYTDKNIKI